MSPSGKGASKRHVEDQVLRDLQLRIEKNNNKGDWVETTVAVEWKKTGGRGFPKAKRTESFKMNDLLFSKDAESYQEISQEKCSEVITGQAGGGWWHEDHFNGTIRTEAQLVNQGESGCVGVKVTTMAMLKK